MYKVDKIEMDGSFVEYIVFGKGEKNLILLPGLSDSMTNIKGRGMFLAGHYKNFAKNFKVYLICRKDNLKEHCTIRDMAKDYVRVFDALNIDKAHILGISQGGMIAQWIAIDYKNYVDKLILGVTTAKTCDESINVIKNWIELLKQDRYGDYMVDAIEKSYSEKKLKQYRKAYSIIKRMGKPKSYRSFFIQANACINHNSLDSLSNIQCETLVIGGSKDKVVGANSSRQLAEKIHNSHLVLYNELGHVAFDETKDFYKRCLKFLLGR